MSLFVQSIYTARGQLEVTCSPALPFLSVRSCAFLLMLPRGDLFAVCAALGRVLESPNAIPTLTLQTGDSLHIGLDMGGEHCWFSTGDAHLRIDIAAARELRNQMEAARAFLGAIAVAAEARPC